MLLLFSACEKNSVLDRNPEDRYSDAVLWSDIGLVDAYVVDAYRGSSIGFTQHMLSTVSDEAHSTFDHGVEIYVRGNITKESTGPWNAPWSITGYFFPSWNAYFSNIQKLNVLLEKIDQVAETYPEAERAAITERANVMKGEAYFLRAFCYTQLLRYMVAYYFETADYTER